MAHGFDDLRASARERLDEESDFAHEQDMLFGIKRTFRVNGAGDTVRDFDIHLRKRILCQRESIFDPIHKRIGLTLVDRSFRDITDGSRLYHVPDSEALDRLVLGDTSRAVRATDKAGVAAAMLVATIIPPLLSLQNKDA